MRAAVGANGARGDTRTEIRLQNNHLRSLDGISLPQLRILDVSHNNITSVQWLTKHNFPALETLRIAHNPGVRQEHLLAILYHLPLLKTLDGKSATLRRPIVESAEKIAQALVADFREKCTSRRG